MTIKYCYFGTNPINRACAALAILAFTASAGWAEQEAMPPSQHAITPGENAINNGSFEGEYSNEGVAEGWMNNSSWSGAQEKYSRESDNVRSGESCQKIQISSKGEVLFMQKNFHVEAGRTYSVSVWLRGEGGMSEIDIMTRKDGPPWTSYMYRTLNISGDWQEYRFEATPVEDDQEALFIFRAKSTGTLYIDDLSVIPGETKRAPLVYGPLPLRLEEGKELSLIVDAKKTARPTNLRAGGVSMVSLGRWTGYPYARDGSYAMTPKMEDEFRQLSLPLTRFYAVIEEEPFTDLHVAIDKIAFFLDRVGIPQNTVMLELEDYWARSKFTPEQWADAVSYSQSQGYSFRYWEIGNEVYVPALYHGGGGVFKQPEDYVQHVKAVSKAIRAVQADAQIGISVHYNNLAWGIEVLEAAAGSYDFVSPHLYSFGEIDNDRIEETVLGDNTRAMTAAIKLQAYIDAMNPGREVYIYDSEWGLHYIPKDSNADKEHRNGNIVGTLYRAVRLLYYARENLIYGASSWKTFAGLRDTGFGVMFYEKPEQRSMLYWLYYYFNNFTGSQVLEVKGTAPYYTPVRHTTGDARIPSVPLTPAMVTASQDGSKIFVMAVNASWTKEVPASLQLENVHIKNVEGVYLSHRDLEAHPLLETKEDFVFPHPIRKTSSSTLNWTMPPGSVVFITIE